MTLALAPLLLSGCSIKQMAVNSLADSLASGGDVFARDDDPQLVREALPFALKTYESLLEETPKHRELLVATAQGFTQYAYGFVQRDAELIEDDDLRASLQHRRRARRLLIRGRDYALRALELDHPGLTAELGIGRAGRLQEIDADSVAALYWSGAAWGAAIAVLKDDADLIGDLSVVEALLRRVLELEEGYQRGAAHEVMMTLEASLAGGSIDAAREHFARVVELTDGHYAAPFVSYAENIAVQQQDRARFDEMIERALAIDPDEEPGLRLANLLAQDRARWLQQRTEELFLE